MSQLFQEDSVIIVDLDGTYLSLRTPTPYRVLDPELINSIAEYEQYFPGQFIISTGRDQKMVGMCLNGKALPCALISSNGAELTLPNNLTFKHAFTKEELNLLQELRADVIDATKRYPYIYVETDKPYELGFHRKRLAGHDNISDGLLDEAADALYNIFAKHLVTAQRLKLDFQIEKTEVTHTCFNHAGITKSNALSKHEFAKHLKTMPVGSRWPHVIYIGDSFLFGNDRDVASLVKKKGGRLIQVVEHPERMPPADDIAAPDFAVSSPEELVHVTRLWMKNLVNSKKLKIATPTAKFGS